MAYISIKMFLLIFIAVANLAEKITINGLSILVALYRIQVSTTVLLLALRNTVYWNLRVGIHN